MKSKLTALLTVLMLLSTFLASAQITYSIPNVNTGTCAGSTDFLTVHVYNGTYPYVLTYTDGSGTHTTTSNNSYFQVNVPTAPGVYNYTVVSVEDDNGEIAAINQQITVNVQPLPNVQAVVTQTLCTVTICGSGAMSYTMNNGATTCQAFTPPIGTTIYTITGSGPNGCQNTAQATVTFLNLPPSSNPPVAAIDSAYCNDGSIQLSLPTPAPFSVSWNGLNNTSPLITGLSAGSYSAVVVDTNGCIFNVSYTVPLSFLPSTCGIVKGSIYYDLDESCSVSSGDVTFSNRVITANPGNYIALSQGNGNYELRLDPGTYTISEVINYPNVGSFCTPPYTVTVAGGDVIENINFVDTVSGEIDLEAYGYFFGDVRPDFDFTFRPSVRNLLPVHEIQNVEAWFIIPAGVTFLNWNYPHSISSDTVFFNAGTGNPYMENADFHAENVDLGDLVTFCVGVETGGLENNTSNNIQCVSEVAVGSFDPNDKTTFVNGSPTNSKIYLEDQTLDYVIRFQNTGTADAINVSVLDTIQDKLNLASFQLIETSHDCNLVLLENNVLKFDFPFIHLPDSTTDEIGSHGFIHYRIRQHSSNVIGNVISNTAYIYFDFNEAVITNTTHDLIVDPAGLEEMKREIVHLYPNPTAGKFTVIAASEIKTITLCSLSGQILNRYYPHETHAELDLSHLGTGIYLLNIESEGGVVLKKVQRN